MTTINDVFRIDGHTPARKMPYRVSINGELLRNESGEVRKYHSLLAACKAAEAASHGTSRKPRVRMAA